jgi:predicted Zn-dependent protease
MLSRNRRLVFAFVFAFALTISALPTIALDLGDVFRRVLPSAIQIIQLSNISDQDEVALGQSIDQQIRRQVPISRSRLANQLVKQVGELLVKSSDRPSIPYTFQVVDDPDLNAFATMGGFVYINTGTIAAADNLAELAGVIAHEIGHISGQHALEQMRQMAIAQGVASVAGVQDDRIVNIGVQLALRLPRSREAEFDADRRGVLNLARAGIAPQGMVGFMQKLARGDSGGAPDFLRTHPATGDRINTLNQIIRDNNLSGANGLNNAEYRQLIRRL